jgi:hypothetical protein
MEAIKTIKGEFTAKVYGENGGYSVGYGYEDADGFNLCRPLKWFKTFNGAGRYAYKVAGEGARAVR